MSRKLYPFHGENLNLSAIAKRLGLIRNDGRPTDSFRRKVQRLGYEKALELTESKRRSDANYVAFGTVAKTIEEWCRVFGMSDTTVFSRIKMGWEVHSALTVHPDQKHVARPDSMSEESRKAGLKMQTVWARRKVHGWTKENSLKPIDYRELSKRRAEGRKVAKDKRNTGNELFSIGIIA